MKTKAARRTARTKSRKVSAIALVVEDDQWTKYPATLKLVRRAARLALDHPPQASDSFTLLLSHDARLRQLNRDFRGKDKPTNVLAFLSRDPDYLGDVAIALGVVEREALKQAKTVPAHAAHLAIHGILHLKGYDHVTASGRAVMESAETLILSRLGLPSPYTPRPYVRTAKAVN